MRSSRSDRTRTSQPRRFLTAIIVILAATLLVAQTPLPPPGTPPAAPEDLCAIGGRVVNALTSEALRGATVLVLSISPYSSHSTETDATGQFGVKGLKPGTYQISAQRAGFRQTSFGVTTRLQTPPNLTLTPGQTKRDVDIKLPPYDIIAGRVTDSDGEPMANVEVSAKRRGYLEGQKQLLQRGSTRTNDLGAYRLFVAAPGRYYVSAAPRPLETGVAGEDRSAKPRQEGHVMTFYPGTPDAAAAAAVDVTAGGVTAGIDIKLAKRHLTTVRGRVVNLTGITNTPISIILAVADDGLGATDGPKAGPNGEFELRDVAAGSYTITARVQRMVPPGVRIVAASQPVQVGSEPIDNLTLTLPPGADISGNIRVEEGGTLDLKTTRISISSRARDAICSIGPAGVVDENGNFRLNSVSPVHCDVQVTPMPLGFYLKSAWMGGRDVLEDGLDASVGTGPLQLVLSPKAPGVSGSVTDEQGAPVSDARVVLAPQEARRASNRRWYQTATTDSTGRFNVPSAAPGEYKLFAWPASEDILLGAYMDTEFRRPVEEKGQALTLREGESRTVALKILPLPE